MNAVVRSLRPDIRNPVLKLQAIAKLQQLDEPTRALLSELLFEIQGGARVTAEKCWRMHKAPMAAYWKAVGVYAGHIARAIRARAHR